MNNIGHYQGDLPIAYRAAGWWRLGRGPIFFEAKSKPNWFVRMMMRLLLDFHWLDL